jgi:hypothetical protein
VAGLLREISTAAWWLISRANRAVTMAVLCFSRKHAVAGICVSLIHYFKDLFIFLLFQTNSKYTEVSKILATESDLMSDSFSPPLFLNINKISLPL